MNKHGTELKLSAKISSQNQRHATITVFQNGANAGSLCVDVEHAEKIVGSINAVVDLLALAERVVARYDAKHLFITGALNQQAKSALALAALQPGDNRD